MPGVLAWGYYPTDKIWLPIQVDANGRIKADMSAINLDDLADVSVPAPTDGYVLYWDAATSLWKCKASPAGTWAELTGKPDSPSLEELATEHDAAGLHASMVLDNIGDVEVPTPTDGYILYWDDATSLWKCRALVDADIPATICRDSELAYHETLPDIHHATHLKTLADHPLSIIPTMDDDHIPAAIARDAEVATAVSDHAALATGVHGAGANVLLNSSLMTNLFTPIAGQILTQGSPVACPSPFSALIMGTPTATSVVYDTDTNEASIAGLYVGAAYWGRIMLFNSTRGTYRKIVVVNITTNTITTEPSTDTWADNDVITTQSQINTTAGYFDLDVSANIPVSATVLNLIAQYNDRAALAYDAYRTLLIHPLSTYDSGSRFYIHACVIGEASVAQFFVPVISQKITVFYRGTANLIGVILAAKGYY